MIQASIVRFPILDRAAGQIGFHPQDRADPRFLGFLIKRDGPIQDAVIRQGDRGHAHLDRPADQVIESAEAIQQRIFAVDVQVDERHEAFRADPARVMEEAALLYNSLIPLFPGGREPWGFALTFAGRCVSERRWGPVFRLSHMKFSDTLFGMRAAFGGLPGPGKFFLGLFMPVHLSLSMGASPARPRRIREGAGWRS